MQSNRCSSSYSNISRLTWPQLSGQRQQPPHEGEPNASKTSVFNKSTVTPRWQAISNTSGRVQAPQPSVFQRRLAGRSACMYVAIWVHFRHAPKTALCPAPSVPEVPNIAYSRYHIIRPSHIEQRFPSTQQCKWLKFKAVN